MNSSNSPLNRIRCTVGRIKTSKYNNLFMHTFQFLTNASVFGFRPRTTPRSLQILPGSHFFFESMSRDKCNSPSPAIKKKRLRIACNYRLIDLFRYLAHAKNASGRQPKFVYIDNCQTWLYSVLSSAVLIDRTKPQKKRASFLFFFFFFAFQKRAEREGRG